MNRNLGPQFGDFIPEPPMGDWASPGYDPTGRPAAPRHPDSSTTGVLSMRDVTPSGSIQYGMRQPSPRMAESALRRAVPYDLVHGVRTGKTLQQTADGFNKRKLS